MAKDVKTFVHECQTCQVSKPSNKKPLGLIQPLPIPTQVWEDISTDFITHLPLGNGKSIIWVIVDRLSKFAHFNSLPSHFTATTVGAIFLAEAYHLHSMPKSIVSDRDRIFVSKFWLELFRLSGTKLAFSSAYHPQIDGQTKVTNHILETYLCCFVSDSPKLWVQFLPLAEFWYNSSYQSAIQMSPFEALYGRPPQSVHSHVAGSTVVAALDETLLQRRQILQLIRDNLSKAQQCMRSQANIHHQDRTFQVGDMVLLCLQPYRQLSVRRGSSPNL